MNANMIKQTVWAIPLMVALSNMPANSASAEHNLHTIYLADNTGLTHHIESSRQVYNYESVIKDEQQIQNRAVPVRWS